MRKNIVIVLLVLIAYIINQNIKNTISLPFVGSFCRCYLNDLMCGIAFPAYCNILLKTKNKALDKLWMIILLMMICGIIWETIPALAFDHGVSDVFDIISYMTGGFIYYLIIRFSK